MKIKLRTEIFPILCIVIMFVLAAIAWPQAPDSIPIHWGIDGQPDNYAGRFMGLLGAPLIAVGMYGLFFLLPLIDPRKENYEKFWPRYLFIRNIMIVVFFCIELITFLWVLEIDFNMSTAVFIVVGLLMFFIGNYMGKLRPTWFVGIRTPWTLSSDVSWDKTHRVGGKLFVVIGLFMIVAALVQQTWAFITSAVVLGVVVLVLYVYSYLIWKTDPDAGTITTRMFRNKRSN